MGVFRLAVGGVGARWVYVVFRFGFVLFRFCSSLLSLSFSLSACVLHARAIATYIYGVFSVDDVSQRVVTHMIVGLALCGQHTHSSAHTHNPHRTERSLLLAFLVRGVLGRVSPSLVESVRAIGTCRDAHMW